MIMTPIRVKQHFRFDQKNMIVQKKKKMKL